MLQAALFDLDDTLYPELTFVHQGLRSAAEVLAKAHGTPCDPIHTRMLELLERDGRGQVFDGVVRELGLRDTERFRALLAYRTVRPTLSPFSGAFELLGSLRAVGIRTGIITDGMGAVQRRKLAALGLESRVDFLLCTDELGPQWAKPSTLSFEIALAELGASPSESVYVGNDSRKDFAGPNRLGMSSICLRLAGIPVADPSGPLSDDFLPSETLQSYEDLRAWLFDRTMTIPRESVTLER